MKSKFTIRQITVAGMLSGISILMATTILGYIPLGIANATTMHIPTIIGSILEGPYVGTFIGLIFGVSSFLRQNTPLFADPIIAIVPRLLIGIVTYNVYKFTKSPAWAAFAGTLTNTIGVLGLAVLLKYIPLIVAIGIVLKNTIFEVVIAIILTTIIVRSVKKIYNK